MTYQPAPAPVSSNPEVENLARYVVDELQRITAGDVQVQGFIFAEQTALPAKPYNGMMLYFSAGVAGASEGFYGYEAGAWTKL